MLSLVLRIFFDFCELFFAQGVPLPFYNPVVKMETDEGEDVLV